MRSEGPVITHKTRSLYTSQPLRGIDLHIFKQEEQLSLLDGGYTSAMVPVRVYNFEELMLFPVLQTSFSFCYPLPSPTPAAQATDWAKL